VRAGIRAAWLGVKASYWFIPSLLSLLALFAAVGTIAIDRNGGSEWLASLGWFEPSRPGGARAQLSVIASAAISISSTVFAITIAAVAYASGNYGPRLLNNFMDDRGNQVSLGVFIATFAFNLMVLRVVRESEGEAELFNAAAFVPQVSVLVSTGTAILAVGFLVYFLHHVPASIRINTVLGGIGRRLIHGIEERFPIEGGSQEAAPGPGGDPITANRIGYVEIIDFESLDDIARECGAVLTMRIRTGDFVHPHLPLVAVSGAPLTQTLCARVRDSFSVGDSRTPTQDLEFLIDELVEIALRALSPGINDPFTAITSIHWMGAAMAKFADRDLSDGPEQSCYDKERVRPLPDDFEHFLRRSFGGVRYSAAQNPNAAPVFIEALWGVALGATSEKRRAALLDEARRLVTQAEIAIEGPALEQVRARLHDFERSMAEGESTRR